MAGGGSVRLAGRTCEVQRSSASPDGCSPAESSRPATPLQPTPPGAHLEVSQQAVAPPVARHHGVIGVVPAQPRLLALRGRVGDEGVAEGGAGGGPAREGQQVRHLRHHHLGGLAHGAAGRARRRALLLARRLKGRHHRLAQPLGKAAEGQALRGRGAGGGGRGGMGVCWTGEGGGWHLIGRQASTRSSLGCDSLMVERRARPALPATRLLPFQPRPARPPPSVLRTSNGSTPCSACACGCASYCGRGSARAFLVGIEMLPPTCILKLCGVRGEARRVVGQLHGLRHDCRRAACGPQQGQAGRRRGRAQARARAPHPGGSGVRRRGLERAAILLAGRGRVCGQRHALERSWLGLPRGNCATGGVGVSVLVTGGLMGCRDALPGTHRGTHLGSAQRRRCPCSPRLGDAHRVGQSGPAGH